MRWLKRLAFGWRKRYVVIPRAPENKLKPCIVLSNPVGMNDCDYRLLEMNEGRIILAHCLGLDLAIHRGEQNSEWLIAGEHPSSDRGFVVVRNQDA